MLRYIQIVQKFVFILYWNKKNRIPYDWARLKYKWLRFCEISDLSAFIIIMLVLSTPNAKYTSFKQTLSALNFIQCFELFLLCLF